MHQHSDIIRILTHTLKQQNLLVSQASAFVEDFIQLDHRLSEENVQSYDRLVHHGEDKLVAPGR